MFGQKSMSSPRVPASRIAFRAAAVAVGNWSMLMTRFGMHNGWVPAGVVAPPQVFSNTWMRSSGRSQT